MFINVIINNNINIMYTMPQKKKAAKTAKKQLRKQIQNILNTLKKCIWKIYRQYDKDHVQLVSQVQKPMQIMRLWI